MPSNGGTQVYGDGSGDSGWTSVLDGIAGAAGNAQWARLYREGRSLTDLAGRDSLRDALMGSSFFYAPAPDPDEAVAGPLGHWAVWGTTATTRFSGAEDTLSIDGDVATATLGLDSQFGRWMTGLALSHSGGRGGYTHPEFTGGELESTLTQLTPFARFRLNERTALWGTLGYGTGRMTLSPGGAVSAFGTDATDAPPSMAAGLTSTMAAFGGRMELSRSRASGGLTLAVLSDARFARTASDATEGMTGVAGATSRVRLMIESRGSVAFGQRAMLIPLKGKPPLPASYNAYQACELYLRELGGSYYYHPDDDLDEEPDFVSPSSRHSLVTLRGKMEESRRDRLDAKQVDGESFKELLFKLPEGLWPLLRYEEADSLKFSGNKQPAMPSIGKDGRLFINEVDVYEVLVKMARVMKRFVGEEFRRNLE